MLGNASLPEGPTKDGKDLGTAGAENLHCQGVLITRGTLLVRLRCHRGCG